VIFLLAAIFFCLLVLSPGAALAFAVALLALAALVFIADHRVREHARRAELLAALERGPVEAGRPPADLPARVITDRDHPLAAIGGVPRREGR
jgi:hypothetical protein